MKIDNIIVSNENLDNLTATITFNIIESIEKVNVFIKINEDGYTQILADQGQGSVSYNITKGIHLGVNHVNIKISHGEEEYISETFLIKLKSDPSIEEFGCSYSDSMGKFKLLFRLKGDNLFVYRIDLKLDDGEYQEIMSSQVQGVKEYSSTSSIGKHTCRIKLYDGYDTYETEEFSFKITNQKPILSNILVTNILNDGSAIVHYAVKDIENSTLTHTLTIDNNRTVIKPTRVDKFYSYNINRLSVGKHSGYISITDGIDTVVSETFEIEIFSDTTNKKTILQQSKIRYDEAYESLKNVISSVVSDGIFDYDIENVIIQKAQEYYVEMYSEFNKVAQQSIDIIGTNKSINMKKDLESQLEEVSGAILNLEDTMETTFKDGILTDAEKDILRNNLDLVAKEKNDIDKDYETLYNNKDLLDPTKTKLLNSYNSFIQSHNNLVLGIDRLINKTGIIDDTDKNSISNLFELWRDALGNYRTASLESIDSIAKKRVDESTDALSKRWSDLTVDLEGVKIEVGNLETKTTTIDGQVSNIDTRLTTAEQKITDSGVETVVQRIQTLEGNVTTITSDVSKISQKADSIELSVQNKVDNNSIISAINMSTETITIKSSKINITGFVTFSDLSSYGSTTIHGGNIKSRTISADKITGGTLTAMDKICFENEVTITANSGETEHGLVISAGEYVFGGATNGFFEGTWWVDKLDVGNSGIDNYLGTTINMKKPISVSGSISGSSLSVTGTISGSVLTVDGTMKLQYVSLWTPTGTVYTDALKLSSMYLAYNPSTTSLYVLDTSGEYIPVRASRFQATGDVVCNSVWASTKVYANNVALSSDVKLKSDIRYVNVDSQSEGDSGLISPNVLITTRDMHEFIETLPMVSYRMNNELQNEDDYTYYGFIAQDILYTKVGSELVEYGETLIEEKTYDEEGRELVNYKTEECLKYSENKFIAFICGALQEEIQLRKELEEKVIELENKLK